MENIKRGNREDGAGRHTAGCAANAGDNHILKQARSALVHPRQANGQDRDGDGGFHPLADLQRRSKPKQQRRARRTKCPKRSSALLVQADLLLREQ